MAYADSIKSASATKKTVSALVVDLETRQSTNAANIATNTTNNTSNKIGVTVLQHTDIINTSSATKQTMHTGTVTNLTTGSEVLDVVTTINFSWANSLGTVFSFQYDFGGTTVGPYTFKSPNGFNSTNGKTFPITFTGRFEVASSSDLTVKTEWFSNGTVSIYSASGETRIYTRQGV